MREPGAALQTEVAPGSTLSDDLTQVRRATDRAMVYAMVKQSRRLR